MFRLLTILSAAMFLTLLIGGRDHGQERFGLAGHYAPEAYADLPPAARRASPAVELAAAPAPGSVPQVVQAAFPVPQAPAAVPSAPLPVAAPAPAPAPAEAAPEPLPLRWVSANAVNVRQGPSTNDAVIGRLTRNEAVSVVGEAADGWLRIRIEGDGIEGYVAARLLTDRAP